MEDNIMVKERQNVPLLRFPEFSGAWVEKKLGELINYKKGYPFKSTCYTDSGVRIIRVSDLSANSIKNDSNHTNIYLNEYLKNDYKEWKLNSGDLIITTVGSRPPLYDSMVGKVILFPKNFEECYLNQNTVVLKSKANIYQKFIYCNITQNRYLKHIENIVRGNANQVSITLEDLFSYAIKFPLFAEQTKIAEFLSVIDDRIDLLTQKKKMLETYKKGVMQKLFSQELRFKDENGKDFPDWNKHRLGEITKCISVKNKNRIEYPVYSISNKDGFVPQGQQFDGVDSNERGYDISMYKIINKNMFAYNPARINVGSIGYSYDLDNIIISSLYVCFKTNNDISDKLLFQYLKSYTFNKEVKRKTEGGVRAYLFYENFSTIKISLPCLAEQQKIANFLSAIDDKIATLNDKINNSQQYKKGLLQQMFV